MRFVMVLVWLCVSMGCAPNVPKDGSAAPAQDAIVGDAVDASEIGLPTSDAEAYRRATPELVAPLCMAMMSGVRVEHQVIPSYRPQWFEVCPPGDIESRRTTPVQRTRLCPSVVNGDGSTSDPGSFGEATGNPNWRCACIPVREPWRGSDASANHHVYRYPQAGMHLWRACSGQGCAPWREIWIPGENERVSGDNAIATVLRRRQDVDGDGREDILRVRTEVCAEGMCTYIDMYSGEGVLGNTPTTSFRVPRGSTIVGSPLIVPDQDCDGFAEVIVVLSYSAGPIEREVRRFTAHNTAGERIDGVNTGLVTEVASIGDPSHEGLPDAVISYVEQRNSSQIGHVVFLSQGRLTQDERTERTDVCRGVRGLVSIGLRVGREYIIALCREERGQIARIEHFAIVGGPITQIDHLGPALDSLVDLRIIGNAVGPYPGEDLLLLTRGGLWLVQSAITMQEDGGVALGSGDASLSCDVGISSPASIQLSWNFRSGHHFHATDAQAAIVATGNVNRDQWSDVVVVSCDVGPPASNGGTDTGTCTWRIHFWFGSSCGLQYATINWGAAGSPLVSEHTVLVIRDTNGSSNGENSLLIGSQQGLDLVTFGANTEPVRAHGPGGDGKLVPGGPNQDLLRILPGGDPRAHESSF